MIEAVLQREGVGTVFIQFHREHITAIRSCLQRIRRRIPFVGHRLTLAGQTARAFQFKGKVVITQRCRGTICRTICAVIDGDQITVEAQIAGG